MDKIDTCVKEQELSFERYKYYNDLVKQFTEINV
jgi:hypothetical protein